MPVKNILMPLASGLLLLQGCSTRSSLGASSTPPPNVVVILVDDMGYGDAGCYGNTKIRTPNLDRMAEEGVRFTQFYVSQPTCSASRASLLTGCYANRIGINGALNPGSKTGLSGSESTIADILKKRGYATGMAGKWHLGDAREFLPTRHGFDEWLGLPYSNDMWPLHPNFAHLPPDVAKRNGGYPDLPLYDGEKIVIPAVSGEDQAQLTRQYTERAVQFIERNKDRPFFFYLAHNMPHVPLFASEKFRGKSAAGLYGDVIEEIDWSVGEVLAALKRNGLDDRTLVIFTSDNGPWLSYGNHGGSAGPLREGKGTCWEGGVRVPCIMRWPGRIQPRTCDEPVMTIDLLPTLAQLTRASLGTRKIDGLAVWPLIAGQTGAKNPHEAYYLYYETGQLQAVISGHWKLQLPHTYSTLGTNAPGRDGSPATYHSRQVLRPELYDLGTDVGESRDVSAQHPEVVNWLEKLAEKARSELGDSLLEQKGSGVRKPGSVPPGR